MRFSTVLAAATATSIWVSAGAAEPSKSITVLSVPTSAAKTEPDRGCPSPQPVPVPYPPVQGRQKCSADSHVPGERVINPPTLKGGGTIKASTGNEAGTPK